MYKVTYVTVKDEIYSKELEYLKGAERFVEILKNEILVKYVYPIEMIQK